MKNLGQLMKQAQEMQTRMAELQQRMAEEEVSGSAGAGMVTVVLNGKGEMKRLQVDPSLLDPGERGVMEDLVVAAHNDAKQRVEQRMQEAMAELTGGLGLPGGFKLPFG